MGSSNNLEVRYLADQLERSFHGGAWHGPATREVVTRIDAALAGRRPEGSAHSIVDLVRHVAFWLDAAQVRLVTGRDVASADEWAGDGVVTGEGWARAIAELEEAYAKLHAAVLELDDDRLGDVVPGSDPTIRGLILGTLQHNAYHTGQIVQIAQELTE